MSNICTIRKNPKLERIKKWENVYRTVDSKYLANVQSERSVLTVLGINRQRLDTVRVTPALFGDIEWASSGRTQQKLGKKTQEITSKTLNQVSKYWPKKKLKFLPYPEYLFTCVVSTTYTYVLRLRFEHHCNERKVTWTHC